MKKIEKMFIFRKVLLHIVFFLIINLAVLYSCSTTGIKEENILTNSYTTLSISKVTYNQMLTIAGDLYKKGIISKDQKNEIIKIGKEYKKYHNLAIEALSVYNDTKDLKDQSDYLQKVAIAAGILSDLINSIQPYVQKEK